MTFRMRPSVSGPTGMVIGAPVSTAFLPRTRPSVVSMAMVRTVFSPRCCATSSTSGCPGFDVQRVQDRRQLAVERTSTTAPSDLGDRADRSASAAGLRRLRRRR
jgi:hypothetical protein